MLQTGETDIAAADGLHPEGADFQILHKGGKIHGVGVHPLPALLGEQDVCPFRTQGVQKHPIRAVSDAGFVQGTIERNLIAGCLGIAAVKQQRGAQAPWCETRTDLFRFYRYPEWIS